MANSKRRCPFCKEYNRIDDPGTQFKNNKLYCNVDCMVGYAMKIAPKAKKQMEKKRKSEIRQAKIRFKENDLKHQLSLTQISFNRLVRLLDANKSCVSCSKPAGSFQVTAGHFLTVGSTRELRFNFMNCHGQCGGCNMGQQRKYKGDRATTREKFEITIVDRYGQNALDWLLGPHETPNYLIADLKAMRKLWDAESRRLEKGELPSRDWRSEAWNSVAVYRRFNLE